MTNYLKLVSLCLLTSVSNAISQVLSGKLEVGDVEIFLAEDRTFVDVRGSDGAIMALKLT